MTKLRIPEQYINGFSKIITLDEDSIFELLALLEEAPTVVYLNPALISSKIASKIKKISPETVSDIIEVLLSLYVHRVKFELPLDELVENICQALEESEIDKLRLPNEKRNRFKEYLIKLLGINSIGLALKATDLLLEHKNCFHEARILSDIRPVFGSDTKEAPQGAVIVHTLKMSYKSGDQLKEFFITLDSSDLDVFIKVIERAKQKTESLKSLLTKVDIPYVNVT